MCVRHLRLTFIKKRQKGRTRARLRNKRPREGSGRSIPPRSGLVTYVFFGSDLKSYSVAPATAVSYGDLVATRRRAHNEVTQRMQPDNSDESVESNERVATQPPRIRFCSVGGLWRRFSVIHSTGSRIDGMRATEISEHRAAERRLELPRCNRCREPIEEEDLREVVTGLFACPFCRGEMAE